MSHYQMDNSKKLISLPTVASSFVGIIMAVPIAFAISGPMRASAVEPAAQVETTQSNVEDFAKFAHAFNQGYEASAVSASSPGGASCSEATVSGGAGASDGQGAVATTQSNAYATPVAFGGKGGGTSPMKSKMSMSERTKSMVQSFYNYTSMTNNSSTINNTNVNSNNTVGSHNKTKTEVNVDANKNRGDVVVGRTNESTNVQKNANESFNKDSYNTKTDITIINDSFKKDSQNTTTVNTDVDLNKETYIDKRRETNVDINKETTVNKTEGSYNSDSSNSGNNSGNTSTTDVDVEAHVDILSDNDVDVVLPESTPSQV